MLINALIDGYNLKSKFNKTVPYNYQEIIDLVLDRFTKLKKYDSKIFPLQYDPTTLQIIYNIRMTHPEINNIILSTIQKPHYKAYASIIFKQEFIEKLTPKELSHIYDKLNFKKIIDNQCNIFQKNFKILSTIYPKIGQEFAKYELLEIEKKKIRILNNIEHIKNNLKYNYDEIEKLNAQEAEVRLLAGYTPNIKAIR